MPEPSRQCVHCGATSGLRISTLTTNVGATSWYICEERIPCLKRARKQHHDVRRLARSGRFDD